MQGWIKLHRSIIDWEWYGDKNTLCLFVHLLISATHNPSKWRGISLSPGQVITGRRQLSEKTGLSERCIRTSLNKLKSTNEVTIKTTKKYSIITIVNWESYQENDQQSDQVATNKRPSSDHIQECKERKNVKKVKNPLPPKVGLDELSVDHIADWLAQKRSEGRYIHHDPHFVLEKFKDYCISKGKKYADYKAAYRGAFDWDKCQPIKPTGKQTWESERNRLIDKYRAEAEREEQDLSNGASEANLRIAETIR